MVRLRGVQKALLWVFMGVGLAAKAGACVVGVTTDFEKLYCTLVEKGQAVGLPSYDDFRRNPPATQRLLLKRPAAKAGLLLPQAQPSTPKKPPAKPAVTRAHVSQNKVVKAPVSGGLKGCSIQADALVCAGARYVLHDNKPNSQLAAGVLEPTNPLILPAIGLANNAAQLQSAYEVYLHKMMAIGLAGATLTYSKFYYLYEDAKAQKQDFNKRFTEMYFYLQKDKKTIATGREHKGKTLPTLDQCEFLNRGLIVCDNAGRNWIYAAQ